VSIIIKIMSFADSLKDSVVRFDNIKVFSFEANPGNRSPQRLVRDLQRNTLHDISGDNMDDVIKTISPCKKGMTTIYLVTFYENKSHEWLHEYTERNGLVFANPYALLLMNEQRPGLARHFHATEWLSDEGRFMMTVGVSPNNRKQFIGFNRVHPESRGYGDFWWLAFQDKA